MSKEEKNMNTATGCDVEAIVSFDERGQLVIPKDVRKKFNLKPGEKFALVSCMNGEDLCCFTLIKTSAMQNILQGVLSPVFANME